MDACTYILCDRENRRRGRFVEDPVGLKANGSTRSRTTQLNRWEWGVAAGAELWVTPTFGFTTSGLLSSYSTEDADLSDVGLASINSGTSVGFRFGFKP